MRRLAAARNLKSFRAPVLVIPSNRGAELIVMQSETQNIIYLLTNAGFKASLQSGSLGLSENPLRSIKVNSYDLDLIANALAPVYTLIEYQ